MAKQSNIESVHQLTTYGKNDRVTVVYYKSGTRRRFEASDNLPWTVTEAIIFAAYCVPIYTDMNKIEVFTDDVRVRNIATEKAEYWLMRLAEDKKKREA